MQLDPYIVDAAAEKGGHEVFYSGDRYARAIGQGRAERSFDRVLPGCRDLDRPVRHIRTEKTDPCTRPCRMQDHRRMRTGMQSDAGATTSAS